MLRTFSHSFSVDGQAARASVSPCSWMYPSHGLQVEVNVAGGRWYNHDRSISFEHATEADVVRLAEQVRLCACAKCGGPAILDPSSNRKGQCEACFMAVLNADLAAAQAKASKRAAAADRKQAAKGYKFKTTAWVHPSTGDDYQIMWYSVTAPTAAEVGKVLKARRSSVTTDYTTTSL